MTSSSGSPGPSPAREPGFVSGSGGNRIGPVTAKPGRPRSAEADRAIHRALMKSLIDHGFAGTSMTGIAKSAGVSSATVYRRYNNLDDLIIGALAQQVEIYQVPDTGSLETDLRAYLRDLNGELSQGLGRLLPALIEEASRNKTLADAMDEHVSGPGRRDLIAMFERAIERGEMRPDIDLELAVDLASGPLYIRCLGRVLPLTDKVADQLADLILAAFRA